MLKLKNSVQDTKPNQMKQNKNKLGEDIYNMHSQERENHYPELIKNS